MAGDRGLAFVVVGLIGASLFWNSPPRAATPVQPAIGMRSMSDAARQVTADLRSFSQQLKGLARMRALPPTPPLETSRPWSTGPNFAKMSLTGAQTHGELFQDTRKPPAGLPFRR